MLDVVLGLIGLAGKVGDKLIEDKDKKTEFAFKTLDISQKFMEVMLNTKTYPSIDGLVKLAYAGEQIIKGLFRPLASVGALIFVVYAEVHGIALSEPIKYLLASLAPAWGLDRALDKRAEKKLEARKTSKPWDEEW